MKRIILIGITLCLSTLSFAQPPSAGWNFGNDTYGQRGGSLVLNSLSDRYGISTFESPTQNLGTNDYIPENGVKNMLALDGYTKAYDYNPGSQTGYGYRSIYNQPLPTDVPLTKLDFKGLDGDPTKTQSVYVPTSEYDTLSAPGQAKSIKQNMSDILSLNNDIKTTNSNLVTEATNRTVGDQVLQSNINSEANSRIEGDTNLQNNINTTNSHVDALDNRVNSLTDEVHKLGETKCILGGAIRLYDSRKWQMNLFDNYDTNRKHNDAAGLVLCYKLGKSYEEKILETQKKMLINQENQLIELRRLVRHLSLVEDK